MRLDLTREQKIADRYLRSYMMVPDRIGSHLSALERGVIMRDSTAATAKVLGRGRGGGDKISAALAVIDEAEEGILREAKRFGSEFAEVEDFISRVQRRDRLSGKALRMAYIDGMSADGIADSGKLGCSRKTVYELIRRGLDISFDLLSET